MRSLSSRLLLAMTGVAALGAVLAGLVTAPAARRRDPRRRARAAGPAGGPAGPAATARPAVRAARPARRRTATCSSAWSARTAARRGWRPPWTRTTWRPWRPESPSRPGPAPTGTCSSSRPGPPATAARSWSPRTSGWPTRSAPGWCVASCSPSGSVCSSRSWSRRCSPRRLARPLAETAAAARRLAAGERGVPVPTLDHARGRRGGHRARRPRRRAGEQRGAAARVPALGLPRAADAADHDPGATPRGWPTASWARTRRQRSAAPCSPRRERMERYVADLLALSRLEADDFSLHLDAVDVAALVEYGRCDLAGPGGAGRRRPRGHDGAVLGAHRRGPAPPGPRRARRQRAADLLGRRPGRARGRARRRRRPARGPRLGTGAHARGRGRRVRAGRPARPAPRTGAAAPASAWPSHTGSSPAWAGRSRPARPPRAGPRSSYALPK